MGGDGPCQGPSRSERRRWTTGRRTHRTGTVPCWLVPGEGHGAHLALRVVTSDQPRRHYPDLYATDQTTEVERRLALGAQRAEWHSSQEADFVVLRDPDGNPFCMAQKSWERGSWSQRCPTGDGQLQPPLCQLPSWFLPHYPAGHGYCRALHSVGPRPGRACRGLH
ncbi:VOC family protein [Deinococcus arcticus]|uniref:VOC family protein n=1 Tax=Deinococcus arcticus TaxID=2136176 RepID=UPI001E37D936|nr:VOC family protein [Deinococcus arcticus]